MHSCMHARMRDRFSWQVQAGTPPAFMHVSVCVCEYARMTDIHGRYKQALREGVVQMLSDQPRKRPSAQQMVCACVQCLCASSACSTRIYLYLYLYIHVYIRWTSSACSTRRPTAPTCRHRSTPCPRTRVITTPRRRAGTASTPRELPRQCRGRRRVSAAGRDGPTRVVVMGGVWRERTRPRRQRPGRSLAG